MKKPACRLVTIAILLAAALASAVPASAQATAYAPTYLDPIDLGTLGGNETRAYGGNGGRIVGASQTVDGVVHAFRYENGALTDLGTLGGSTSWGFAINSSGAVVGSASVPGDTAAHAFLWTEELGMVDLGTLGGTYSRASGINDSGLVSGWSQIPGDGSYHAFVWDPTTGMRDLGTFGGNTSFAYDIGTVVCGEAETPDGSRHGSITTNDVLVDLGTLGGSYSAAINCSDPIRHRIVGESSVTDDSATHAVWWDSQLTIRDLGTLGGTESRALGTSIAGETFGESRTVDNELHPVRWWSARLADFTLVLGADSHIESVVPVTGDFTNRVVSGAVSPGADVHAYIVSVPRFNDVSAARSINEGVIEVLQASTGRAHFAFATDGVSADLRVAESNLSRCQPCAAGDLVSLSQNQLVTSDGFGSATVQGNQYDGVAMPQVGFRITADAFAVPATGEQWITVSSPFTYSGFLLGALRSDWQEPDQLFGVSLSGAGTATLQLFSCDACVLPDGRRFYDETTLKYGFEPQ